MKEDYNKIVVLQTAYIGDVVVSTGLVRELNKIFPDAKVDIITTPVSSEIFQYNPYVRKRIKFDKKNWKYINFFKLVKKLKNENYDLSISIQSSLTSALLLYFSGIKRRVGFSKQVLTTDSVRTLENNNIHRSENIVNLLSPLSSNMNFDNRTELFLSDKERQKAKEILTNQKSNKKMIGVAPGSVRATKKWPKKYFAELTQKLKKENIVTFFIGNVEETQLCEEIIELGQNDSTVNMAGELSLLESAALIEKLDLMLANDSAPLHIANAVNTDVFAFFGPTVQKYGFFPYRENDKIFEKELDCRPCSLHGGPSCPEGHHNCMKKITPEEVFESIRNYFNT